MERFQPNEDLTSFSMENVVLLSGRQRTVTAGCGLNSSDNQYWGNGKWPAILPYTVVNAFHRLGR